MAYSGGARARRGDAIRTPRKGLAIKAGIVLLVTPAAVTPSVYTDRQTRTPNSVQCTTTQQPRIAPPASYRPQIVQPDFAGAYQRGFEFALRAQQTRLENQLFEEQLRERQRQNAADDQQVILAHQAALDEQRREDAERLVRPRKALEQTEACIRLNTADDSMNKAGLQNCVDRLKVSDPDYARALAEMNDISEIWDAAAQKTQSK